MLLLLRNIELGEIRTTGITFALLWQPRGHSAFEVCDDFRRRVACECWVGWRIIGSGWKKVLVDDDETKIRKRERRESGKHAAEEPRGKSGARLEGGRGLTPRARVWVVDCWVHIA